MNQDGVTLVEQLALMFVAAVSGVTWGIITNAYGTWAGIGAGLLVGLLSLIIVILYYRWNWRRENRILQELREKYRSIYRVVTVPLDPKIIIMPEGAEVRIGDYGWEAGPIRNDGLIYLQGLTPEWTVVWHMGFHPDQIEMVATKPDSQYDYWRPYWAAPQPPPPCPFPVVERETLTMGLPHYSHSYFVNPIPYPSQQVERKVKDG